MKIYKFKNIASRRKLASLSMFCRKLQVVPTMKGSKFSGTAGDRGKLLELTACDKKNWKALKTSLGS